MKLTRREPTPEDMRKELEANGWEHEFGGVWKSPCGALFYGPVGAWEKMKAFPQLNMRRPKREISIIPEHEQEGLG